MKVEDLSLASGVGVKVRPVNCDTVSASSKVTGVTPSERSTLPSVGRPVTVTARSLVSKAASVGVVMSIGVALLFSATVSEVGVVEGWPTACAPGTVSVPENSPLVAKVSVKRKPLGIVVGFPDELSASNSRPFTSAGRVSMVAGLTWMKEDQDEPMCQARS